jgi:hypothetical protein
MSVHLIRALGYLLDISEAQHILKNIWVFHGLGYALYPSWVTLSSYVN